MDKMMPWFFALDHIHYAWWLSVHVFDMKMLPATNTDIYQAFEELCWFFVSRTRNSFLACRNSLLAWVWIRDTNSKIKVLKLIVAFYIVSRGVGSSPLPGGENFDPPLNFLPPGSSKIKFPLRRLSSFRLQLIVKSDWPLYYEVKISLHISYLR